MAEKKVKETPRKILLNAAQVTCFIHPTHMFNFLFQGEKFKNNKISTAKYNLITFIPRYLFEQFRRWVNGFQL